MMAINTVFDVIDASSGAFIDRLNMLANPGGKGGWAQVASLAIVATDPKPVASFFAYATLTSLFCGVRLQLFHRGSRTACVLRCCSGEPVSPRIFKTKS